MKLEVFFIYYVYQDNRNYVGNKIHIDETSSCHKPTYIFIRRRRISMMDDILTTTLLASAITNLTHECSE